ncbi:MAG: hypothetical protein COW24_03610 [Candidatus Kerfeldbacteria bacterium CG15_BIG_FIL_POST_REV_8_21_14_020_45_12]|uniref:Glycosyl transferase family 1 domain-containing protein n=1 Tax=Candidatus Kerfeldbacteria bacterium CG15_BIG_FIL_POST_REV_8_21_14_020_45_12 TaxID=2014247 RepID=A0A2M7H3D9_9BACT|nr:MAG: hypothetical protein COW24_03610 [Candidatus Kerfeldbacteria bacterium CG15_BIG_FIL_POST_REV_8_21_14_020_45_12]PJA93756.1 MAG: hypothetical protein CO132_01805 [Candidatus Kerfeldbacteria bacterium CG_4_9_14_3_um_filter_45_8]
MDQSRPKRVAFFARALTQGGVTRFLVNLFHNLQSDTNIEYILFTDDESLVETFPGMTVVVVKSKHKLLWDYFASLKAAKKYNVDIVFYTKNIVPFSHFRLPAKKVIFVYDLGYYEKTIQAYPFMDTLYMKMHFPFSVRQAHAILPISSYTKDDLIAKLKADPKKITVMLLAAEDWYQHNDDSNKISAVKDKYKISSPFLFYCGNLSERKNLRRVIEAFNQIKDQIPDHNLYFAGPKTLGSEADLELASTLLGDRFKHIGFADEADMPALYSAADVYLFPSLYEGFGLPILEANACGCPVLTSNATSCPEIAGTGAHIVDPLSVSEIADGILKITTNSTYKDELVQRGYDNVKNYNWKKTAQVVKGVITDLL